MKVKITKQLFAGAVGDVASGLFFFVVVAVVLSMLFLCGEGGVKRVLR